jgi:ABC-type uncharacterized transport system permease subunit
MELLIYQTSKTTLPLLYGITILIYLVDFIRYKTTLPLKGLFTLIPTVIIHLFYLLTFGLLTGHHPMTTLYEFLSFVSMTLALVYLSLELGFKTRHSGLFVLPIIFLLQLISSQNISLQANRIPLLNEVPYELHSSALALAYSAFLLSTLYSMMLLLFHNCVNTKNYGLIFERLPSYDVIYKIVKTTLLIGFIFMTLGLLAGGMSYSNHFAFLEIDLKIILSLFTWFFYGLIIFLLTIKKISKKTTALLSLLGFTLLIISTITSYLPQTKWHNFLGY